MRKHYFGLSDFRLQSFGFKSVAPKTEVYFGFLLPRFFAFTCPTMTAGLDIQLADNDFLIDLPAARFSDLYDIKLNLHSFHAIAQVQFPCP
jgi:hypothetical protein